MKSFLSLKRYLACGIVLAGLLLSSSVARANVNARSFDWTQHGVVTPVRNQGNSNNCWAVAATEAFESNWALRHRRRVTLSPQPILDRTHQTGADRLATAFGVLINNGTTLESLYPYTHVPGKLRAIRAPYRAARWGFIKKDASRPTVAQMKQALIQHGPLAVGVQVTAKFRAYKGGIFREALGGNPNGMDHFVLIVGWNDATQSWRIKNSWGTTWGEQGYMRIAYNSDHIGSNAAWVESR